MKFIIRWVIGISYKVDDSLKEVKQFILVGNHNSHLDTATILSGLPMKQLLNVSPVAAADYFGRTPFTTFMSYFFLDAVLIKRKKGESGQNPIDQIDEVLKSGRSILIFPEGSRGNPEEMQSFKKGIGILLDKNPHIPFIPVFMDGLGRALPKGDGLLVPFNGSINFGAPLFKKEEMSIDDTVSFVESSVKELIPK